MGITEAVQKNEGATFAELDPMQLEAGEVHE